MSFLNDWKSNAMDVIERGAAALNKKGKSHPLFMQAASELHIVVETLDDLLKSTIIKMPDKQLQEFLDIPVNHNQDFTQLRSPFKSIYMDVTPPLVFKDFYDNITETMTDTVVHGVMITEEPPDYFKQFHLAERGREFDFDRAFKLVLFAPVFNAKENTFICSFTIHDGKLERPVKHALGANNQIVEMAGELDAMHARFVAMGVHIMNYLTSPSIVLEPKAPDAALQKARIKRGKAPLPGWYEIRYAKTKHPGAAGTGEGAKHGFRYDVRGHFKHIKKGALAGRVVWCPAHQRGLANETYKPKGYRVEVTK